MMVPIWAIAVTSIAFFLLALWSILAGFAWGGATLELRQLQRTQKLLQIDIYALRPSAVPPLGDPAPVAADRDLIETAE